MSVPKYGAKCRVADTPARVLHPHPLCVLLRIRASCFSAYCDYGRSEGEVDELRELRQRVEAAKQRYREEFERKRQLF